MLQININIKSVICVANMSPRRALELTMSSKPISMRAVFFYLLLIFFCISTSFKLCYTSTTRLSCPEIEKQALLKMKQSFDDPSNLLSSWENDEGNCCMWNGVVCSNSTGHVHVHQLHLQGLSGEVNPSLASLRELKYLDLSQNDFEGTIPSFMGLLTSLEYLNLSFAGFGGRVPHSIGNLSNLHTLSMEGNGILDVDDMEWVSGLSRLEHLNMNGVDLSQAPNWAQVINTLPSLLQLHLRYCQLNSSTHVNMTTSLTKLEYIDLSVNNFESFPMPRWIFQQPNLTFLDLSQCGFEGPLPTLSNTTKHEYIDLSDNRFESFPMPRWIFQQPNLIFLDLSACHFEGPIPAISNTTKLKHIHLSENNINSSIPDWLYSCTDMEYVSITDSFLQNTISNAIGNMTFLNTLDLSYNQLSGNIPREISSLCKLQNLDLSNNYLGGEISDSFGNMSDCFLETVTSLVLTYNQLSGNLTPQFGEFKSLETLYLGRNSISGAIPINIGKLSSLKYLGLQDNKLIGNLPESLGLVYSLRVFFIEHNMLQGVVTERHFANLSKLEAFTASGNHLTLKVSSDWVPLFQLSTLQLGSWNLGADIPSWIQTQKNVDDLDLSNTGISGNIPTWFNWEIRFLNLSHNNLQGEIPDISGPQDGPRVVFLSSNHFSGSLPRVANNVTELDLSNNSFSGGMSHFLCDTSRLVILHLGGNQLTGELPDCFMKLPDLMVLNLANNNLSGNIPNSIGFLANMLSLNLHGNKFSGRIPFSMHNCTQLVKLDLGGNGLTGNIPTWMGTSLEYLTFLILRSNKLSGEMPSSICHLNALQILDLSNNAFSGVIPKCVNNFTAMATKRSLADYFRFRGGSGLLGYSFYIGFYFESASVATKGREHQYDKILSLVTNIDLSNNNLSGDIPKELTTLVELRSINFSGNHLAGKIPDSMGDMKQLESLDLSNNSLLGEIPNSFTHMFALNYLNLSFNNLRGRIPSSTQLRGMDASSFIGTNLCGPPLQNKCSVDPVDEDAGDDDEGEGDDESLIKWLYIFLSLGYAVGLSTFCTTLILNKSWRAVYFGLIESIWNKIYVFFCIKWASLTRAPIS